MQVKSDKHTVFGDELRFIPRWAWVLAGLVLVCIPVLFTVVLAHDPKAPPFWGRVGLGTLCGIFLSFYCLLIGYVNRDAGRRGMNRWVWTLLAMFVPNALGIILYFLLRQPLPSLCPQCGTALQTGFNFCPRCSFKLSPSCPQCQRVVGVNDVYCPYCATSLRPPAAPAVGLPTGLPG
ncbi:MAG TPA: zinc ribbon domain-containing protein [Candidatus Sulfotelmatobacter sp.]|nr:zinc ribbon domain-containing protein [Candidatus Sulfotelmatobacter sp.]